MPSAGVREIKQTGGGVKGRIANMESLIRSEPKGNKGRIFALHGQGTVLISSYIRL